MREIWKDGDKVQLTKDALLFYTNRFGNLAGECLTVNAIYPDGGVWTLYGFEELPRTTTVYHFDLEAFT